MSLFPDLGDIMTAADPELNHDRPRIALSCFPSIGQPTLTSLSLGLGVGAFEANFAISLYNKVIRYYLCGIVFVF